MSIGQGRHLPAIFVAALSLSACTPKPAAVATSPTPPPPRAAAPSRPAPVASSILPGSLQDFRVNVGDTVHFAYNAYDVQETDKPLLTRQAQWLSRYPAVRITIEGNCDERGTREYNLALGARRANAVKQYLVSNGVASARIATVSYGKERPLCVESSESCWAQNRRAVTDITSGAASPVQAANRR